MALLARAHSRPGGAEPMLRPRAGRAIGAGPRRSRTAHGAALSHSAARTGSRRRLRHSGCLGRAHRGGLPPARQRRFRLRPGARWWLLALRRAPRAAAARHFRRRPLVDRARARRFRRDASASPWRPLSTTSTTPPRSDAGRREAEVSTGFEVLLEARHQLDEVARAVAIVELMDENALPAVAARTGRAGQGEKIGAAGDAARRPALDRRGPDLLVAQPAEELAEAGDLLLVDGLERFGGDVPAGDAGAARRDDDVDHGVGNPGARSEERR